MSDQALMDLTRDESFPPGYGFISNLNEFKSPHMIMMSKKSNILGKGSQGVAKYNNHTEGKKIDV